jgi:hypothetical protein
LKVTRAARYKVLQQWSILPTTSTPASAQSTCVTQVMLRLTLCHNMDSARVRLWVLAKAALSLIQTLRVQRAAQ